MMGTDYVQGKYYVYKESGVKIARSARIGHGVVFGKGTVVEDDAEINHATIGRNCVIGRGVRIQESHLYDGLMTSLLSHPHPVVDVIAEAGSTISYSIVGENSVVKAGSTISR
jgi:NDP-sugar pyrophosphorylase family protein